MTRYLSVLINGAIAVLALVAWGERTVGQGTDGSLLAGAVANLRYFTILSNVVSGLVSAAYALALLRGAGAPPAALVALKLGATTAVTLTFLTVALLLGPPTGWENAYAGGNLWLHLVLPLLAVLDCCLFVPVGELPLAATLVGLALPLLYGSWYLRMVMVHGAEEQGRVYDLYGFLRWGPDKALLVAVAMLGISWAIAALLRLLARLVHLS